LRLKDCFQLGYFEKTHGVQGELVMVIDADNPAHYKKIKSLFVLIEGNLVPQMVESIQIRGNKGVVKLEAIRSHAEASKLKGKEIYLPDTELPKLKKGQFYYHELIGLKVEDENLGELGTVTGFFDLPNNELLGMEYKGKEILIPFTDAIVRAVYVSEQRLITTLPEGLLEIYLEDQSLEDEV
jgi:16S rRNA processing protein RimM